MLRDRVRGCILGGVIGDAFGTPSGIAPIIERRSTTQSHWGYTDDSAMLLAVAKPSHRPEPSSRRVFCEHLQTATNPRVVSGEA